MCGRRMERLRAREVEAQRGRLKARTMKTRLICSSVLLMTVIGCDRGSGDQASTAAYAKRVADTERRATEYQRQLDVAAQHLLRAEEDFRRYEAFLEKQESQQRRVDALLERWERLTASIEQREKVEGR